MTIHCDEPLPLVHGVCRDRFRVPPGECSFKRQYAQLYVSRLSAARPHLVRASFEAWGAIKESEDIQNISPVKSPSKALKRMRPAIHNLAFLNLGETCVIIGILYKVGIAAVNFLMP
ncbi:unnamed protein product [Protopolystoma xenopodis]|uniref:DNA polymerase delta subunit OB-fold domain-containing protein n=1 Tax=Protopolystoma xenopodis TaxID=117903 RepID=A0A3S5ASL0_9PLAT|nr:unnamed protein product [Protopolystoma xenopodis]